MDIPLRASAYCDNELVGHVTRLVVDVRSRKVTHLVVRRKGAFHTERLVNIKDILSSTFEYVEFDFDPKSLSRLTPFLEEDYLEGDFGIPPLSTRAGPDETPERTFTQSEQERVSSSSLAVRRGASVYAKDGRVGQIDGFIVEPEHNHITYVVWLKKYGLTKQEVTLSAVHITDFEEERIFINLSKADVAALKHFPVKRQRRHPAR